MRSPSSRESLQALPDWSAVPSDSEEDRQLVNQRIAYFGAVFGLISGSFFAFNLVIGVMVNPVSSAGRANWLALLTHPATLMHPAATAVYGVLWWACRKGKRSAPELNVLDVGGLLLASVFYALMISLAPGANFKQSLILALIMISTLNTHAIIVPATARRTAWVSALAALPVPLTAYWIAVRNPEKALGQIWIGAGAAAFIGLWCLTGIATSALASRIIYGLQERVRAATELGQYTLEEQIGQGGMGAVYRARHALLRRPTAIKLMSSGRGDEPQIRRFEREVQLTASLTHPNTIAIYDFGRTPDGVFYYAMEYIEGITLEDLIEHAGPQQPRRIVHILMQVCAALIEAHHVGLVHRDIKPANIMLSVRGCVADQVKVLDFGLVKELSEEDAGTTAQNTVLGTPHYLAPEMISEPSAVGARADLYALGAVGYQLLTGRTVFEGKTVVEVCSKHLFAEPVPPSLDTSLDVPAALEQVILACLAKAPDARPASAAALCATLAKLGLAEAWTPGDAQSWWDVEAPKVMAQVLVQRRESRGSAPATVAIDLARRQVDGHVANLG
jgi:eukaryotic-like serine/threonine-protein kinase